MLNYIHYKHVDFTFEMKIYQSLTAALQFRPTVFNQRKDVDLNGYVLLHHMAWMGDCQSICENNNIYNINFQNI